MRRSGLSFESGISLEVINESIDSRKRGNMTWKGNRVPDAVVFFRMLHLPKELLRSRHPMNHHDTT